MAQLVKKNEILPVFTPTQRFLVRFLACEYQLLG